MGGQAALGEAQVAIRATMEKLDSDLNAAKSKIGSVMGGITGTLGNIGAAGFGAFGAAATGAIGAIAGVGVALGGMAKDAASVESVRSAFNSLAGQAGTTGKAMLAAMQEGSGGTIAARDLMLSYNKAASLVSLQFANDLPNAMTLVANAAASTGQDMGFLMDSLVTGVGRVSPMILDNLGIQVSLTEAVERYAEANGLAASELSKQEQQEAVRILTMEKLQEKYGEMDGVFDSSAAKMQQMTAAWQNAKDQMGTAFMPVLTTVVEKLTELMTGVMPVLTPLVSGFANAILGIFDAISPLIPILEEFVNKMAIVLDSLMGGDVETAFAVFTGALGELSTELSKTLPEMVKFGAELVLNLVDGIVNSLGPLLDAGVEIMMSLLDTIIDYLPEMLSTGIDLLLRLVDGITQAIPNLIPAAVSAVTELITTIIGKLPDIIATGIDLLIALKDGILAALPDLIAAVPELIIALTTTIISMLPDIIIAGVEIILALAEGLIQAIPQLVGEIPRIFDAIDEALKAADARLLEMGKHIVEGLKQGISNAWDSIKTWFAEKVKSLIGNVKDLLGIKSPSKVFAEIGKRLNEGFAVGIKGSIDLPEKQLQTAYTKLEPLMDRMLEKLDTSVKWRDVFTIPNTSITQHYNLTANYKYQDEKTLIDQIKILNLLGAT